jgi:GTP1/Obg family GTP-binding protein
VSTSKLTSKSPGDVLIPVMGMPGSGKSTFVSLCTGEELDESSYFLDSYKTSITLHSFNYCGRAIHLVDTPSFGSANRSDKETFEDWAYWLLKASKLNLNITGMIYMHQVDKPRVTSSQKRWLEIFKRIYREENYSAVIIATTSWDVVTREEGEARIAELLAKDYFWKDLYSGGAHVEPVYQSNHRSALRVISLLLGHAPGKPLEM